MQELPLLVINLQPCRDLEMNEVKVTETNMETHRLISFSSKDRAKKKKAHTSKTTSLKESKYFFTNTTNFIRD